MMIIIIVNVQSSYLFYLLYETVVVGRRRRTNVQHLVNFIAARSSKTLLQFVEEYKRMVMQNQLESY